MSAFLGIDPGAKGGLAIIHADGAKAWRYPGDVVAAADLLREVLTRHRVALAAVEKVSAMPGNGVAGMFRFGANWGAWLGMLAMAGVPHVLVTPRRWQSRVLDSGTGETKARALAWARRRFPEIELIRKADDGKADALGLAEYARRLHLGGSA